LLEVSGVEAGYGRVPVLRGVGLHVEAGEIVALLGPNGAGKTTLLRVVAGALPSWTGSVRVGGTEVAGLAPERVVAAGVALVPEGRRLFPGMTVTENLLLGVPYELRRAGLIDWRAEHRAARKDLAAR
jgi:branched-chain amino acid transport system ATP-binding protein